MLRDMTPNTHRALSTRLCGELRELREGEAVVELTTHPEMRADEHALVHGGFVFGLADHAAMLAINHPNVVLGSAETRFLAPVVVGEVVTARAKLSRVEGKKHFVEVEAFKHRGGDPDPTTPREKVFTGTFVCFVPGKHVLEGRS
jgi:acyl-coenzyme A thioesterase PaaI-like protein